MKKLYPLLALAFCLNGKAQCVYNVAGGGTGNNDSISSFGTEPDYLAIDNNGNIYFSNTNSGTVYKVNPSGVVNLIGGTGVLGYSGNGGLAISAMLYYPRDLAVDGIGNVYISESNGIRKITPQGIIQVVDTIANIPSLAVDLQSNLYYTYGYQVFKLNPTGVKSLFAGNGSINYSGDGGQAIAAGIDPSGVAIDIKGNVFITDATNYRIRKVNTLGIISTYAGNGINNPYVSEGNGGYADSAYVNNISSICTDLIGNVYFLDFDYIRKIDTLGIVTVFAGSPAHTGGAGFSGDGGPAVAAMLRPNDIKADVFGNVYIADDGNYRIRKVNTAGIINTIVGNGTTNYSGDGGLATLAQILPCGVAVDNKGVVYIADAGNNRIRKVDTNGIISTIAGNGVSADSGDGGAAIAAEIMSPNYVKLDSYGNIYIASGGNMRKIDTLGIIHKLNFGGAGFAIDKKGNIYTTDALYNVYKIDTAGNKTIFAGTSTQGYSGDGGPATAAELWQPSYVAIDKIGNVYISDCQNYSIRKVDTTGVITTFAGKGTEAASTFNYPANQTYLQGCGDIAFDSYGNLFIVGEYVIYKVDTLGILRNYAGLYPGLKNTGVPADSANLVNFGVNGIAIDMANNLYYSSFNAYASTLGYVRKISPSLPTTPQNVTNGNQSICSGNSIILAAAGNANLTWYSDSLATNHLGSGNYYLANPSDSITSYYVRDNSSCGVSALTQITVNSFSGCVWPGDANEDLIVNNVDLLPIGIEYGKTGAARSSISNTWQGFACNNWIDTLNNGKNIKYADCNGDSTINFNDTLAINLNFNLNHAYRLINPKIAQTTNPDIYINFNKPVYYPGDTVLASVYIGSNINSQSNFYGSAFTINYNNANVKSGSEQFYFNNSWVGNINQSQIKFSNMNTALGIIDASLVRITHTDTGGYGKVATLRFILRDTLTGNELYFTVNNGIKTNHNGVYSNLNTGTDSVALVNGVASIKQFKGVINELTIYPNPNNGSFVIEPDPSLTLPQGKGTLMQVYDVNGRLVLSQTINGKTNIDANSLNEGVYNISLLSNDGVVNKRLVIVR